MKKLSPWFVLCGTLLSANSWAATLTFPSGAPCNTTLQACINAAASGDIVEVQTNSPIDESLSIGKSLTLRAAAGFTPTIGTGNPASLRILQLGNLGSAANNETVIIERLHFNQAYIGNGGSGLIYQGTGHTVIIRDNVFYLSIANNNTPAVEIDNRVPLTAVISGNQITSIGPGIRMWAIVPGAVDYTVERNVIHTDLPSQSYSGIDLDLRQDGTNPGNYTVKLYSNVIYGVGGCNCGFNSGIGVDISNAPAINLSVANNTVDGTQTTDTYTFLVRDTASVTLNLFNNIASNGARTGFRISKLNPAAVVVLNANANNSFGNADPDDFAGLPPGVVTNAPPYYVARLAGNLRVEPFSSMINAGVNAPTGGTSVLDADGAPRILGPQIDVGAYEQAARIDLPSSPVPTLGPLGLAALAGLLGAGAVLSRRRRRTS